MRKQLGKIKNEKLVSRLRRKLNIRKTVIGTSERPRLCVTKSTKHLRVQVIDDQGSKTLFSVQSFGKDAPQGSGKNVEGAKVIGKSVAEKLKANNVNVAVFDRAGYKYTGAIAALVDAIRENGIQV